MTEKVYIEHEGQLYRGTSRGWPDEVYYTGKDETAEFRPYKGKVPKGVEFGTILTEDQAKAWMRE